MRRSRLAGGSLQLRSLPAPAIDSARREIDRSSFGRIQHDSSMAEYPTAR
jgi:hypothetical protein